MNVKIETTKINNEDAVFLLDIKKNKCIYLTINNIKELIENGEIKRKNDVKIYLKKDYIIVNENGKNFSYKINCKEILNELEYNTNRLYGTINFSYEDFVAVVLDDGRDASFKIKDIKEKTKKTPIREFNIRISGDMKYINTENVVILENIDFE